MFIKIRTSFYNKIALFIIRVVCDWPRRFSTAFQPAGFDNFVPFISAGNKIRIRPSIFIFLSVSVPSRTVTSRCSKFIIFDISVLQFFWNLEHFSNIPWPWPRSWPRIWPWTWPGPASPFSTSSAHFIFSNIFFQENNYTYADDSESFIHSIDYSLWQWVIHESHTLLRQFIFLITT